MAGGYTTPPSDPIDALVRELNDIKRRLSEVEAPSGTQIADAVQTLTNLVEGLLSQVDVNATGHGHFGTDVTAGTSIAAGTSISAGTTITATGDVSGANVTTPGTVTGASMVNSVGAYNNDITATRRGAWWRSNGDAGYASSSLQKKVLVGDVEAPDIQALLNTPTLATYYQYKAELDKRDNPDNPEHDPEYHVALEWGSIAEWFHALGLWQFVVYEDHETPIALHYEMMGLLGIETARHVWGEFQAYKKTTDARLAALEGSV